jgi:hypothetical protein
MIPKNEFDYRGYMNKPIGRILGGEYKMKTVPNVFVDPDNPPAILMQDAANSIIFKSPYGDCTKIDDFIDNALVSSGEDGEELALLKYGDPDFARFVAGKKSELMDALLFNKINDSHMKAVYRALSEFIIGINEISGIARYAKDLQKSYTQDFFGNSRTVYYAPITLSEFGYADNSNSYNVNLLKRYMIYKCQMKTTETYSAVVKAVIKGLNYVLLSSGTATSDLIEELGYSLVELLDEKFEAVVQLDMNNIDVYIKNIEYFDAASYAKSLAPMEYDYDLAPEEYVGEHTEEDKTEAE